MNNNYMNELVYKYLNLTIFVLVACFIFLNPFPHATALEEFSFYLPVLILFFLIIFKKTVFSIDTPLSIPFGLFVFWGFFGLLFALNINNSLHDLYAHLIKYIVLFYLLVNYFGSKEKFKIIIWIVIISSTIYAMGMMIYFYLLLGNELSTKMGLYIGHLATNVIGTVTVFPMLLALYSFTRERAIFRKIFLIISMVILAIASLATQTRGTILAMIFALILSFRQNKKVLIIFSLCIVLAMGFMPVKRVLAPDALWAKISGGGGRIGLWLTFIEMVKDHPITGIGYGMETYYDLKLLDTYNARVPLQYKQPTPEQAPHNLLIDVTVRMGFVGLMFFLYILFSYVRMGWKIIKYGENKFVRDWAFCLIAAFFALLIQGFFENTLSGPPAIVLYTQFGMMTILWRLHTGFVLPVKNRSKL